MNQYVSADPDMSLEGQDIVAYVSQDGEFIDINKSINTKGKRKKPQASNSIDTDEDEFGERYSSGRVYRPTLNLKNLKEFSMDSLYHLKCMKQIAIDAFTDFEVVRTSRSDEATLKKTPAENRLMDFLDTCVVGSESFLEFCRQLSQDYQTFGFFTFELIPTRLGDASRFKRISPETCRVARNLAKFSDSDERYVMQVVNTHERIYKLFDKSEPYEVKFEPHTNQRMTEIVMLRNYHVLGGKYGIPDWVPALKSIIGNDKVAEYNINFFQNQAVPRFAVIVKGGNLDTETKSAIKNYFKTDLKGNSNAHKTLVLTTQSKETEIKLVPLATDVKDGGFRNYRKDNRDEIISAHGVPPHRVQVYDSGGLASGGSRNGVFDSDKTYKYSNVAPIQRRFEDLFNSIFKTRLGITNAKLEFKPLDIGEDKFEAEVKKIISAAHDKYVANGTLTIDEVRKEIGKDPYSVLTDDPEIKEWASTPRPVFLLRKQAEEQLKSLINQPNVDDENSHITESSNEFDEKSEEVKDRNRQEKQISTGQLQSTLMKSNSMLEELSSLVKSVQDDVTELKEVMDGGIN